MSSEQIRAIELFNGQKVLGTLDAYDNSAASWVMSYTTEPQENSGETKIHMSLYFGFQKNPSEPVKLNKSLVLATYEVNDELKKFYDGVVAQFKAGLLASDTQPTGQELLA